MVRREKKETQEDLWIKNIQEDSLVHKMNLIRSLKLKRWRKKSVVKGYKPLRERKSQKRSKIYSLGTRTSMS